MTFPHLPSSSALASAASPASSPSSELAQWPRASTLSPMPARSGSAWAPPPAAPASSAARQRTPKQAPPKKDDQDTIEWLPNAADPPNDSAADLLTAEHPSPTLLAQATNTVRQVDRGNLPGQTDTLAAPSAPAQSDANPRSGEQASAANRWSTDLLKPLSEHSPSAAAAWFGAVPTGAVLSGSAMALMALSASIKSPGTTPADTEAPNLLGAAISSGNTLVLRYNENLSTVLPAASAFQVKVDGSVVAVSSVARGSDQSSLLLTLATPVTSAQQVTVSTVDGSTIRDVAGNTAATFRDQAVTVTVTDQTAPTLQNFAAITNADTSYVVLRFSETLQSNTVLDPASFQVSVSGSLQTISAREVIGDTLRLTLATKITGAPPNVLLSYTPPADTSKAIQDSAGNRAVAIGPRGGITVPHSVDTSAPIVNTSGSDVAATDRQVREIRLNFNDNLDASALPSPDSFLINVTSGGSTSSGSPSSLKISGSQLILTLTTPVNDALAGLQVRYTPPSTGNALKDWAGNRVATFERSVATVDGQAPSWVSSRFTSNQTLELTFDEALAPQTQAPNLDTFSLTANGGTVLKPTTSTVSGRTLTLGFGAAILSGQAATLTYTAPTLDASALNRALQDTLGNDSGNLSRTLDTAGPTLTTTGTSTNGLQVLLNYNESLLAPNANGTPAVPAVSTGAYVVRRGDGTSIPVNSVTISGSQVQLGLATALKPGDTLSVFYTAPTANIGVNNAAVQDSSGNDAASLGSGVVGQAVTNNTAMAVAQVQLGSQTQALDKVVVQFNEAIGTGSLPAISAFTVKAGTVTQTITGIARDSTDNTKLILSLSGTIDDPGALLVSYVAPNSSNNPITGASGKALGSFTDQNFGQLLTSTSAADTVTGAAGRVDYFLGSAGNDTLIGLGGADHFVWPDFGSTGPGGFTQTLNDFGFKRGAGTLQGSAEADLLDLSQLLNGYTQATEASFLKAIKNADNRLVLQIDHDGGTTFTPTANLVFNNVTVNSSDQLVVNSQFIQHTVGTSTSNLTLANLVEHLRIEGQLTVL
jgi:uncharacterized repeat protein (TIGR02059 family)